MKNILKILLVFLLCFLIILIGKLVYDKINYDSNKKIEQTIYLKNKENELILYSDGSYFMYMMDKISSGNYEINNNTITFNQNKKYNSTCYNIENTTFNGIINSDSNNKVSDVIIDNISLNIDKNDSLTNSKKILLNSNFDCAILDDNETNNAHEKPKNDNITINKKYSHDIIINEKINYSNEIEDKEELNSFLKEFFDKYYNIMETLEYKDISYMFDNKENAYIYKTALDVLIENRKRSQNDLSISNVKYELTIQDYKKNGNEISFTALENCSYNFNFIKQYTSSVYNIKNEFKLVKHDNEYKISSYNKVQDFYVMISKEYKKKTDYVTDLDNLKNDYLKKFDMMYQKNSKMETDYLNKNYQLKKCDNNYDRESAYEYATYWVGRRNTDNFKSHGDSNCVNFVSQVMNAGGIPMDSEGSSKWYSKNKGKTETYSWINVGGIKEYFETNKGFGLCGKYDENIYLGEPGDVIIVGRKNDLQHAITVISQIKDENGKVIDLLVSSNTVDLIYFPLSAYAYPYKTLLKVYGYNN